jgi:hypothetical protein
MPGIPTLFFHLQPIWFPPIDACRRADITGFVPFITSVGNTSSVDVSFNTISISIIGFAIASTDGSLSIKGKVPKITIESKC